MFNLHLQVYKFGWDTKEQKCRLVDVDPNKSPSTFLSTYVDLQVDVLGHAIVPIDSSGVSVGIKD